MAIWRDWLRRFKNLVAKSPQRPHRRPGARLQLETLEDRTTPAAFTPGNIAVLDLAAAKTNTTGSVYEINPTTGALVQTVGILATGANAIRFSDSGTSSFLSDTNDRSLLAFDAYNTTNGGVSDLATTNPRAVGTLDASGTFSLQTTYMVSSANASAGNQGRSATSLNDTNWFITDKGGLYTNNDGNSGFPTGPSLSTNILDARSFGGVVYISSTKTTLPISTASSPTASSLTGLSGLTADTNIQDFYLVQSGNNGSTFDTLYLVDSSNVIKKYSSTNGTTWTARGTYTMPGSAALAMIAGADGSGGDYLYVTTGGILERFDDTAAYNANISVTASPTTLYTATGTNFLKGLDFVPTASALSISGLTSATVTSGNTTPTILSGGNALFADTLTSSQLNTSTLTIAITANGDNANDILGITNQGTGFGQIGVSGANVTYSGTTIGTFTGGSGGASLVVTFNSSATAAAVSTLMNEVNFETNSSSTATRTVQFTFTPSTGNGSAVSDSESVNVQQDTPTINAGGTITLGENHAAYSTNLTGINDGESDGNANVTSVTASVTGGSSSIFASGPSASYTSPNSTATLNFTLAANTTGSATLTVTVTNSFNNTATTTYTVTVNPITGTTTAAGVFAGGTVTITSANLSTTESGVSAANIQYTLTGNPPAADGALYTSKSGSAVALAQNSTFTQDDVNKGYITFTSTGATIATDSIAFSVSDLTNGGSLTGQSLSISVVAPAASLGNLAVLQLGVAGSDNTTGTVLYLNSTAAQTSPVQSIPITSMSFSDSGTSSFLSDSNDGSLLAFAAYNTTTFPSGSDLGTDTATASRAVGTLDSSGNFNLATTYTDKVATSSTTEQTRSATTLDNVNWFITDKDGLYTNNDNNPGGPTGPSLSTNILVTRAFGGTVYVASTKATAGVSTLANPTATTLDALPGLPGDGNIQDFYLIQSGTNGNTYDVLYTLDQTSPTATINKYSLVSGSWTANGTAYTLPQGATSMIAANNGSGGASLYVVTTTQAADNSVVLLTDAAGWNANLNITAAPVTVYTTTGTTSLKGIAFAPTNLPNFSVAASAPAAAAIGAQFNYTLTASNAGPASATSVEVQFTLPTGLSYVSASDVGSDGFTASYDPTTGVVTFTGGSLGAGASDTLTVTVSAASPGAYTAPVGAVVIDPNNAIPQGREFVDNFNTSAVSTNVTDKADLTVNVSGPSTAYTNQPFSYTLTAANGGTIDADGDVTIQFTLPTNDPGLTYVTASGTGFTVNEANGVVTFSGGTVTAGGTATLTVTVEDTTSELVDDGVITTNTATVPVGAAVISTSDNLPEFNTNDKSSTSTVTTTISSPIQITGVDVSPVVNTPFTGVIATFSDATDANASDFAVPGAILTDFTANITWGDGHHSSGTVVFTGYENVTDINGNAVTLSLFTVTGTNTYAAATPTNLPDAISVTVIDANNNSATVNPTASVAYPPLLVTGGAAVNAVAGVALTNMTVATFTDPGLVAALGAGNPSNLESQFTASIDWGDNSPVDTGNAVTISYNAGIFSVTGSHTYSQTGPYTISVVVTPLTLSVERIDSSDPTNLNVVGDENSNTLTDSPSADFIDQYAIGAAGQTGSLYTFSLPTVANFSGAGNEALTNSSYSVSEGNLTLSTDGAFLVTGGYNDTVSAWSPQQTFSSANVINRVIGAITGAGVINTTTDLTDAYTGDNFRTVVSDGTSFWTAGHSSPPAGASSDGFVHYVANSGATTSTIITGPGGASNINTVEIYNGQLYEGVRSGTAGIYQIGVGLPTTGGQSQTMFIQVPQTNPLDVGAAGKPMSPFTFYMTDLPGNTNSVNGVNVAYVADAEMGIARYDYTASGWQFSYYIDSTGSFKDSAYSVDGAGNILPTNPTNPDLSMDPSKAGGVKGLTGRVVNGQVQLFATTAFGTTAQPKAGESLIEVTDPAGGNGGTSSFTTLATDFGASELTGVAFTPFQKVTSNAQIITLSNPGAQNNAVGDTTVSLQIHATGVPTGAGWTYTASGLPSGLSINSTSGLITGTITGTASAYSTQVTVKDGQGDGVASQNFTWNVSALAVVTPATQNNAVGDTTVSLQVSASGLPTGDSWTYSATGLPSGLSISTTTGLITGTITGSAKTYLATVSANDGQGASASSQNFTWNVSVLAVTNPGTQVSVPGNTISLPIQASGLPTGDSWTYSANGLPSGLMINTTTGLITGVITGSPKTYTPTVTASDGQGASASQSFSFYVLGPGVTAIGNKLYIVGGSTSNDQVQINPAGGSVKVIATLNGVKTQTTFSQAFTAINIFLQGGNDKVQIDDSLTITTLITAGNGNDNVTLGNGNNTVTLGNGNDNVKVGHDSDDWYENWRDTWCGDDQTGAGNNTITLGNGNDNVRLGNGANSVTLGNGKDNVQAGDGVNTVKVGDGNDYIQLGDGNNSVATGKGDYWIQLGNGNNNVTVGDGSSHIQAGSGSNTVMGGNGNDSVQLGNKFHDWFENWGGHGQTGNNTVTLGNGNDNVQLGDGNNHVTVGNGNDNIQLGDGANIIVAGAGSDDIDAGDGTNTVNVGAAGSSGNVNVQLGDGANNSVTVLGNGNDQVQVGKGNGASVSITGNGNDQVLLGNGNGDSASITGNGNDQVQVGKGSGGSVSIVGNGNEVVQTGNGSGTVHVAGSGHKTLHLGKGWTQI
jgi:Domain of unknown function DUF11/Putative Ig domain/Cadherin-like/RTX calcium-binding nonapeptide repeat (4 copies)